MELSQKYRSRQEIFEVRLRILNVFTENKSRLTEMELQIVAFILRNYPEGSNFLEFRKRDKIIKHFRLSRSSMSTHFRNLHLKEWMLEGRLDKYVESVRYFKNPDDIKISLVYEPPTGKKRAQPGT